MMMTLLWAMACLASMYVGILMLARNVAEVYFAVRWLLSRIAVTLTPRLWASMSAFAMGAEVKEYAWMRISERAAAISRTILSVQEPPGVKQRLTVTSLPYSAHPAPEGSDRRAARKRKKRRKPKRL
jgi:hypothetical protein